MRSTPLIVPLKCHEGSKIPVSFMAKSLTSHILFNDLHRGDDVLQKPGALGCTLTRRVTSAATHFARQRINTGAVYRTFRPESGLRARREVGQSRTGAGRYNVDCSAQRCQRFLSNFTRVQQSGM